MLWIKKTCAILFLFLLHKRIFFFSYQQFFFCLLLLQATLWREGFGWDAFCEVDGGWDGCLRDPTVVLLDANVKAFDRQVKGLFRSRLSPLPASHGKGNSRFKPTPTGRYSSRSQSNNAHLQSLPRPWSWLLRPLFHLERALSRRMGEIWVRVLSFLPLFVELQKERILFRLRSESVLHCSMSPPLFGLSWIFSIFWLVTGISNSSRIRQEGNFLALR